MGISRKPAFDRGVLPCMEQFNETAEYCSAAFHELTHSTGHESRLNHLDRTAYFGTEAYSKEELIAEIGAAALVKRLRLMIAGSVTIDCRNGELDAMPAAFLQMAGVFSKLELQMIRTRVKSGVANAKAKGKKVGRPKLTKENIPQAFYRHYPAYAAGKMNVTELARVCDLSRPTVYKYIKMVG